MPNLFKDILSNEESLFKNELALDFSFQPKLVKYRENEQFYIANCIKPLFQDRSGKNLLIVGPPGIGKTVSTLHVLNDLNQESDITPIYVNCWKKDTPYKIIINICEQIGYKLIQNRNTEELIKKVEEILNKGSAVLCFDEIDKLDDLGVIYTLLEDLYKKTVLFITNDENWINNIDARLKSRLQLDKIDFKPYNLKEIEGIIKQRIEYAFASNIIEKDAVNLVINKAHELKDVRTGLFLLKEAATIAENKSQKFVSVKEAEEAITKLKTFKMEEAAELDEDEKNILNLIKENSGNTTSNLYMLYTKNDGSKSYRTFYRKIKKLEMIKQITLEEVNKGLQGKSTRIHYGCLKRLNEF